MNDLLQELTLFTLDTDKEQLQEWAQRAEAQIDRMLEKEGAFYYLVLSEFYAVRLRDIQTGYQLLKRIGVRIAAISDEVKVRRCFYKYLEGAYEFALEDLDEIMNNSKNLSSRKIAIDFFRRIFQRDKPLGHSKMASRLKNIQSYEEDFLKALKFQRKKSPKLARETHRAIFTKYGKLDQSIQYQSSKNIIRLMESQGLKIERDEYQEYQKIIKKFEQKLENKNYYQMKLEFIFKVLDFIDPEKESQQILIDFQMAKRCVMDNLEQAIKKNKDKNILATLKETLRCLEEDEKAGQQICYKFLGDKGYNKLQQLEDNKNTKSKVGNSRLKKEQEDEQVEDKKSRSVSQSKTPRTGMKSTHSKMVKKHDEEFQGSNMVKINYNSGGCEERYFYFKEDFTSSLKLYFCSKKDKPSASDDYYSLKGLKSMTYGKATQALKRKECQQFPEDQCFTLKIMSEQKYERNFYVKDKNDFDNWVSVFEELVDLVKSNQSKLKKTRVVVS